MLEEEERGLAGADGKVLLDLLTLFAAEGRIGEDDVVSFLVGVGDEARDIGPVNLFCLKGKTSLGVAFCIKMTSTKRCSKNIFLYMHRVEIIPTRYYQYDLYTAHDIIVYHTDVTITY